MNKPEIKILAISNVYCRLMHFKNKGDVERGHCHTYDHGTLLSSGRLQVDMFSSNDVHESSKIFEAPTFIFIQKDAKHQLTALEDNTVAVCIHALRTMEGDILDPSFFINEAILADSPSEATPDKLTIGEVMRRRGLNYDGLAYGPAVSIDKLQKPKI